MIAIVLLKTGEFYILVPEIFLLILENQISFEVFVSVVCLASSKPLQCIQQLALELGRLPKLVSHINNTIYQKMHFCIECFTLTPMCLKMQTLPL